MADPTQTSAGCDRLVGQRLRVPTHPIHQPRSAVRHGSDGKSVVRKFALRVFGCAESPLNAVFRSAGAEFLFFRQAPTVKRADKVGRRAMGVAQATHSLKRKGPNE